jgi:hypothetical protein
MRTGHSKRDRIADLKKRRDDLSAWLKKEDPTCFSQQKHLEEGTGERVYWHYGYLTAVRDALELLSPQGAKALRS